MLIRLIMVIHLLDKFDSSYLFIHDDVDKDDCNYPYALWIIVFVIIHLTSLVSLLFSEPSMKILQKLLNGYSKQETYIIYISQNEHVLWLDLVMRKEQARSQLIWCLKQTKNWGPIHKKKKIQLFKPSQNNIKYLWNIFCLKEEKKNRNINFPSHNPCFLSCKLIDQFLIVLLLNLILFYKNLLFNSIQVLLFIWPLIVLHECRNWYFLKDRHNSMYH